LVGGERKFRSFEGIQKLIITPSLRSERIKVEIGFGD